MTDPLERLRTTARDAYAQGCLGDATQAQAAALAMAQAAGAAQPDDFLFLGLLHHAAGRIDDALAVLLAGAGHHPANQTFSENRAVLLLAANRPAEAIEACQQALAMGSDSPNVHDGLCEAWQRLGQPQQAIEAGRAALQAKDRRFAPRAERAALPPRADRATIAAGAICAIIASGPPPPFNPANPDENVIAYTLWGNAPRYQVPLLENARILPHLFPGWRLRVYHDDTVDPAVLTELAARGAELVPMRLPPDTPPRRALLWRFAVIADPAVRRFLVRDADALLTVKERVAVDAWLASDRWFHAMRDWYTHTDLLLAGLWGGVGGILPEPQALLRAFAGWRLEADHIDQDLLAETVWPLIRGSVLIHDSIFAPCLGSIPFPPFGALPPGHHIGQNAFAHFSRSG